MRTGLHRSFDIDCIQQKRSNYFRERGTYVMGNKAYLVLENGKVFCGESFGAGGEVTG